MSPDDSVLTVNGDVHKILMITKKFRLLEHLQLVTSSNELLRLDSGENHVLLGVTVVHLVGLRGQSQVLLLLLLLLGWLGLQVRQLRRRHTRNDHISLVLGGRARHPSSSSRRVAGFRSPVDVRFNFHTSCLEQHMFNSLVLDNCHYCTVNCLHNFSVFGHNSAFHLASLGPQRPRQVLLVFDDLLQNKKSRFEAAEGKCDSRRRASLGFT